MQPFLSGIDNISSADQSRCRKTRPSAVPNADLGLKGCNCFLKSGVFNFNDLCGLQIV